jgi:hypothetical protein
MNKEELVQQLESILEDLPNKPFDAEGSMESLLEELKGEPMVFLKFFVLKLDKFIDLSVLIRELQKYHIAGNSLKPPYLYKWRHIIDILLKAELNPLEKNS